MVIDTAGRTVPDVLGAQTRRLGHRPLLTAYDATTGARTELSYATADNWASKTANLLAEQLDVGPGTVVAVDVDGHWSAVVLALACWKAGAAVSAEVGGADLVCCHESLAAAHPSGPLVVVGDGLRAEPLGEVAPREDLVLLGEEVHAFADDYDDAVDVTTTAVLTATASLDHAALLGRAAALATELGEGARAGLAVAVDAPAALIALAGAVVAGGSVVAGRPAPLPPPWPRWAAERVTAVIGDPAALAPVPEDVRTIDLRAPGG